MKLPETMKNARFLRARATIIVTVVRILSFLVVLPDGFWVVGGFTGQNLAEIWPEQQKTWRFASFGTFLCLFVHLEGP